MTLITFTTLICAIPLNLIYKEQQLDFVEIKAKTFSVYHPLLTMSSSGYFWIITIALILTVQCKVAAYHCVVIEDDIPAPFTDTHCLLKIRALLLKQTEFSVEIAASNQGLITDIQDIVKSNRFGGELIIEDPTVRAAKSFAAESLPKSMSATLSTAIGYCVWNIIDNIRGHKVFDFREWALDIFDCGHAFDWKEMMAQAAIWGTASGTVHGAMKAMEEVNIVKLAYKPPASESELKRGRARSAAAKGGI